MLLRCAAYAQRALIAILPRGALCLCRMRVYRLLICFCLPCHYLSAARADYATLLPYNMITLRAMFCRAITRYADIDAAATLITPPYAAAIRRYRRSAPCAAHADAHARCLCT